MSQENISESEQVQMNSLKKVRKNIKAQLTRLCNTVLIPNVELEEAKAKSERAQELLKNYEIIQNDIDRLIDNDEEQIVQQQYRSEIEETVLIIKTVYYKLMRGTTSQIRESNQSEVQDNSQLSQAIQVLMQHQSNMSLLMERFINNVQPTNTSTPQHNNTPQPNEEARSSQHELQLPRVQLPDFDGNLLDWVRFKELFQAFVHSRTNLPDVEKLEFLHTKLKGEALLVIKHLKPMNSNYQVAWDLLKKRYDNTEKIKNAYMELIFNVPAMKMSSLNEIKRFYNSISEGFNSLRAMDQTVDQWSAVLLYTIEKKLDNDTATLWFREKTQSETTTFSKLLSFLERRITELECMQITHHSTYSKEQQPRRVQLRTHTATMQACPMCTNQHLLYQCDEFKKLDVKQRRELVQKHNLCFNCLRANHRANECKSSNCKKCNKRHSTLLHMMSPSTSTYATNNTQQHNQSQVNEQPTTSTVKIDQSQILTSLISNSLQESKHNYTILPTAIIGILDSNKSIQQCRALLDSGSQVTLITESCVQRLNLKRQHDKTTVFGLGDNRGTCTRGRINLNICPLKNINQQITTNALCLSKLTQILPSVSIDEEKLNYFKNLQAADPNYSKPAPIDIILGADIFTQCLLGDKLVHPSGSPAAINTVFGWVFTGQVNLDNGNTVYTHHSSTNLDEQLQRFWEMENLSSKTKQLSPEDQQAEQYFTKTTQRNKEGRYIVKLPLRDGILDIGQSKTNAFKRLRAMENKFTSNPEIKKQYKEFMSEYLQLNHMEVIKQVPEDKPICYLPHHAVLKPTSTTSKLRVVFDASNKTSNGKSLNDNLLTGPKIQNDIFDMIINFRKFSIACVGDIEKMYRQILVNKDDRLMQCILWRNNESDNIETYSLNTVTYGTAAAPYLAVRTLHQIANEHSQSHPVISNIIKKNFYVDDLMYCAENVQEAINTTQELSTILAKSGFHIRKWTSNSAEFLQSIPTNDRADYFNTQLQTSTVLTLGLLWDTQQDLFKYNINPYSSPQFITKRTVLSEIAKLYDPMGWIAPIIIKMKIFMQSLWLAGSSWDDRLPDNLLKQWTQLRLNIDDIHQLKIDRCFQLANHHHFELHGFADASERAYAAAVYVKVKQGKDKIFTTLIAAKTRVTPVKQVSLPRLELCAAHLLVKLMTNILINFKHNDVTIHGWTDSNVVLAWISDHPCRWKTFIANRTSEIISVIPAANWHHIPSKHNPADVASRGTNTKDLIEDSLWWHGPQELQLEEYPSHNYNLPNNVNMEERKRILTNTVTNQSINIIQRYSSLTRLVRITAYIKRFVHNCKNKKNKLIDFLTTKELEDAQMLLIKLAQQESFATEIKIITSRRQLNAKNKLLSVTPFIDNKGILRVGGRIDNANISYNQKHPIILHNQHKLTELIIRYLHLKHCHAGKRLLFYIIHLKFWISSAVKVIKRCIYKCTTCVRFRGQPFQQQMGSLPKQRLTPAPTFSNVGIDFAGPVQILSWKGRGNKTYKAWIAIFVCLVTKAIHIELVSELSTAAFIAALHRFVSRRGMPNHIYSDNGTNFKGAEQYLNELYKFLGKKEVQDQINHNLANQNMQWHFSPPAAPHFGGIWEAGVKSIKYHLRRVLKDARPTYEELQTLLCQIETCLNSRPLCLKYEGDVDPLTPAHFILLRPLVSIPDEGSYITKQNYATRWQYVQKLSQQFWKKWSLEYLHQMQQRAKWLKRSENICKNDIVIIKDDQLAPSNWLMGKIIEVHRGADGLARVATVKTSTGQLKRPIVKLVPLFPSC